MQLGVTVWHAKLGLNDVACPEILNGRGVKNNILYIISN